MLAGGILRSVFFTGSNAIGYADISDEEASQATAFVAVCQQLSVAFGVAVAGAILEITSHFTGGHLSLMNFQIAFFAVGGLSAVASLVFLTLPKNAGADVSGHRAYRADKE